MEAARSPTKARHNSEATCSSTTGRKVLNMKYARHPIGLGKQPTMLQSDDIFWFCLDGVHDKMNNETPTLHLP